MGYPGGKAGSGVYQRIINQIPLHDVYVEPFLGEGAVLLRKRPAFRTIGVEINPEQATRFAAAWAHGAGFSGGSDGERVYCPANLEVYQCCGIEWLRHTFGLYRVGQVRRILPHDPAAPAERDAREKSPDRAAWALGARSRNLAAPAAAAESRGGRSTVAASIDPTRFAGWFVYLDPPYMLKSRRSTKRLYEFEMTDEQHVALLDVAKRLPCNVAISGYHSPLYDATLQTWLRIEFNAMTRGGRMAREVLWMNYSEPAELHDYRYLGDNKRVRERITRKRRTWAAGLRRLPRLERQAVMAELAAGLE